MRYSSRWYRPAYFNWGSSGNYILGLAILFVCFIVPLIGIIAGVYWILKYVDKPAASVKKNIRRKTTPVVKSTYTLVSQTIIVNGRISINSRRN